jgi:hypothetical protein
MANKSDNNKLYLYIMWFVVSIAFIAGNSYFGSPKVATIIYMASGIVLVLLLIYT